MKKQEEIVQKIEATNNEDESQKITEDFSRFTIPTEVSVQNNDVSEGKLYFNIHSEEINNAGSFWSRTTGKIWLIIFSLCLAFASIVSYMLFGVANKNTEQIQIPPATPIQIITKEISPTPNTADLSKYTISVFNGSGIKGEAASVKSMLEKANIQVITVGNAQRNDYEKSVIQYKKSVEPNAIIQIKELLTTYRFDDDVILEDVDDSDIVVILGSLKNP